VKRCDDQRLAERIGIKLTKRTGPHPKDGSTWPGPFYGYHFLFTHLVIATKHTTRCRPGAKFYGSSFGALCDADAWKKALEQYSEAIRPSSRVVPL
jgi:hypothetical protein